MSGFTEVHSASLILFKKLTQWLSMQLHGRLHQNFSRVHSFLKMPFKWHYFTFTTVTKYFFFVTPHNTLVLSENFMVWILIWSKIQFFWATVCYSFVILTQAWDLNILFKTLSLFNGKVSRTFAEALNVLNNSFNCVFKFDRRP